MNINHCAGISVLIFLFSTKVINGEAPEEERVPERMEDIPLRIHSLQNNANSTEAVPVLPTSPYSYNFYYPNPYALYSPVMYNYPILPYLQSPQHLAEPSLQTMYPLNAAGYPIKVAQKFVSGEEHLQDIDLKVPSLMYSPFHSNRPNRPVEMPSLDKNNVKQPLVAQPPTQSSFFQGQLISLANNTETPAVNVNSISLQAYSWPSFASEKPSTTKVVHTTFPSVSGGSFESTAQPGNLSFERETRNLITDTVSLETTVQSNNSVNSHENKILPLNSTIAGVTRSSEEMPSGMRSGTLPNLSNELGINNPVSNSFKNEIILNNLNAIADISEDIHKQFGVTSSNIGTYLENDISAAENILEDKQSQSVSRRKSMEVLNGTFNSGSTTSGNGQNKQLFNIKEDIPNTLVVQISSVHNEKSIEAPQVDPSGNIILFPISSLMQKTKTITNIPLRQHNHHQTSVQNKDSKISTILGQSGEEPVSVTNENYHIGRRNKILDVTTLNSKEVQENTALQVSSTEDESTKKQNKSVPVQIRNRNIIIRLPSGQQLVIDVSHSRDTHIKGSSGSEFGEVPLLGIPSGQSTQQTRSFENIPSEEILPGRIRNEEENVLSRVKNDILGTIPGIIQEGEDLETPFPTPK